jgi:hypothetical protein
MSDLDERLQQRLEALDAGVPLESVLGELHGNSNEISSLVSLASALREAPHPEPPRKMAAAKGKIRRARNVNPRTTADELVCSACF